MKLIDILVQELPKLGGWPIDSDDERSLISALPGVSWGYDGGGYYAFRGPGDSVRHQLYEEALLAIKSGWNGEGLPPVGCRVETRFNGEWVEATVAYTGRPESSGAADTCKWKEALVFDCKTTRPFWADEFRPIRSEADKKRTEAIHIIADLCRDSASNGHSGQLVYDAIAAGKVPGIRIE